MSIAILVHGFNVWDGGRATVGTLRPFFANRGVPYMMVNYGWFGIGRTYTKNKKIAKKVALACIAAKQKAPDKPIILVGHSNGCAIIHLACDMYKAEVDKVVLINPALEKTKCFPNTVKGIDVWYSPGDKAVKWSKYLPFHPWGEMGRTGFKGHDPRVRNFNKQYQYPIKSSAHSDVFQVEKLPYFGPLIVKQALKLI